MVKNLEGLVLLPTVSRNQKHEFFHPDELAKFNGLTVPVYWDHKRDPEIKDRIIGQAVFTHNEEDQEVIHQTIITDPFFQNYLETHKVQVSFGAHYAQKGDEVRMCDKTGRCLDAPKIGQIDDLSLVPKGGIAQATAKIIQSYNISELQYNTSITTNLEDNINHMTTKDSTSEDKIEQGTKITIETSENVVDSKTEKVEQEAKVEPTVETKPAESKTEQSVENKAEIDEDKIAQAAADKVTPALSEGLEKTFEKIQQAWKPSSEVSEGTEDKIEQAYTDDEAGKILQKLDDDGFVRISIDKEDMIAQNYSVAQRAPVGQNGKIEQAITTSGTIPTTNADGEVVVSLAGKTITPVRQFGKFKAIGQNVTSHRFYRLSVPDAGAITESPTTDITASTHTLTSVTVSTSVRGWRQVVERSEFEDNPSGFLNAVRETARVEAIRDEHKLIVQDLGATDHDFGGTTTAPYHINLNDGTAITTTTLEDAAGEADFTGFTKVKKLLQEVHKSALPAGSIIGFISPRAFEKIASDTGLSEYTQIGNSNVTRLGELERLWGIDLLVTNELLEQNNSTRNIFAVKGEAWGLVSRRSMNIQFQDQIAGQYTDIVWTHRIGVDVIEPNAYLIAASKAD